MSIDLFEYSFVNVYILDLSKPGDSLRCNSKYVFPHLFEFWGMDFENSMLSYWFYGWGHPGNPLYTVLCTDYIIHMAEV